MKMFKFRYVCPICKHVLIEVDQILELFSAKLDVICPKCKIVIVADQDIVSDEIVSTNYNLSVGAEKTQNSLDNPEQYR